METKITSPAIKGIMLSLILIVFSLVVQFMNMSQNKGLSAIGIILFFGGIIWSCIFYSKQMNANVTFGNVFTDGFKTSAAVAAIMIVFTVISLKLLFPESIDKALEEVQANMSKQNLSDDQIESGLNMTKKFFIPFAIGGAIIMYLLFGAIASLIGAAIAKKNPTGPFEQQV